MNDKPSRLDWTPVLIAVLVGLLTGLGEAGGLLAKKYVLGILIVRNPQVIWMGPLVYLLVFLPFGLLFAVLGRRWPRLRSPWITVMIPAGAGAWFALVNFDVQLANWAIWILAAGIASRAGAFAAKHPERLRRVARTGILASTALILILAGALNASLAVTERRTLAGLPAAAPGAPNVLLIIFDTVRGLDLGLYGFDRPTTPEIERHARTGVIFDRAVAPASWTNPSHASMFTGRFTHELTSDWGFGLDGAHPTLAEVMRDHGYRTAGFVANTRYLSRAAGLARGFAHYEDHLTSLGAALATTTLGARVLNQSAFLGRVFGMRDVPGRVHAPEISGRLLRWLDRPDDRPFYAALNYMDAHDPYLPPEPWAERFGVPPARTFYQKVYARFSSNAPPAPPPLGSEARVRLEHAAYDASIAYLDHEIGTLLDELDRRHLLDNTLVVFTGDHGEEFNEHGLMGHGKSLYWPVIHVPLVVWYRGRLPEGVRIGAAVSLRDIAATVLDVAGVRDGTRLPGRSWARFWTDGAAAATDTILSELSSGAGAPRGAKIATGDMKSLVIGTRHYIRNGDGTEELYDIAADPFERTDLIGTADSASLAPFRAIMATIPARQHTVRRRF